MMLRIQIFKYLSIKINFTHLHGNDDDFRKNLTIDESLLFAIVCKNVFYRINFKSYISSYLPYLSFVLIDNFQNLIYILDYLYNVRMGPKMPIQK